MNQERLHTVRVRIEGDGKLSVTRMTRARQSPEEEDGWSYMPSGPRVEVDYGHDEELVKAVREALH